MILTHYVGNSNTRYVTVTHTHMLSIQHYVNLEIFDSISSIWHRAATEYLKAGACFKSPKFTGFCEAFLEGK